MAAKSRLVGKVILKSEAMVTNKQNERAAAEIRAETTIKLISVVGEKEKIKS